MVTGDRAWADPQIVRQVALHGVVVLASPEGVTVVVEVPPNPVFVIDVDDRSIGVRADGAGADGFQCLVGLPRRIDPDSVVFEMADGVLVATARTADGPARSPRLLRLAAS